MKQDYNTLFLQRQDDTQPIFTPSLGVNGINFLQ